MKKIILTLSFISLVFTSTSSFAVNCSSNKTQNIIRFNNYILEQTDIAPSQLIKQETRIIDYYIPSTGDREHAKTILEYDLNGSLITDNTTSYSTAENLLWRIQLQKTDYGWSKEEENFDLEYKFNTKYITDSNGRIISLQQQKLYFDNIGFSAAKLNNTYQYDENNCLISGTTSEVAKIEDEDYDELYSTTMNYQYKDHKMTGILFGYNSYEQYGVEYDKDNRVTRLINSDLSSRSEINSVQIFTFFKFNHNNDWILAEYDYQLMKSNELKSVRNATIKRDIEYYIEQE